MAQTHFIHNGFRFYWDIEHSVLWLGIEREDCAPMTDLDQRHVYGLAMAFESAVVGTLKDQAGGHWGSRMFLQFEVPDDNEYVKLHQILKELTRRQGSPSDR